MSTKKNVSINNLIWAPNQHAFGRYRDHLHYPRGFSGSRVAKHVVDQLLWYKSRELEFESLIRKNDDIAKAGNCFFFPTIKDNASQRMEKYEWLRSS
jgi:hypothetical protein